VVIRNKDLLHQWRDVFRFNVGSQVILFNGDGKEYRATLMSLNYHDTRAAVLETKENTIRSKRIIHLYTSLIKKDKLEWIWEKSTELGVLHFHPILSERSEKKNLNIERAEKIIVEAVEQSGRAFLPKLYPPLTLEEAYAGAVSPSLVLDVSGKPLRNFLHEGSKDELGLFIGPEGGWSDREIQFFFEKNIPLFSLGDATLRAETAAIAAATVLLL